MNRKPVVYVMIGLPAAGKSTYLSRRSDAVILSADVVRGEWFGDESLQYTDEFLKSRGMDPNRMSDKEKCKAVNPIVWEEVYRRAADAIETGHDAVIDGIFTSRWGRGNMIRRFRDTAWICGVWMTTDLETCIERDKKRSRTVGEERIREIASQFEAPAMEEGFDILEERDMYGSLLRRTVRPGMPENTGVLIGEETAKGTEKSQEKDSL